ncbi:hypothetical protein [Brevundimonas sp.]|jgi:hypothetical protein|uniref:hypothetical protein n=1 Tax=Brevundimonas sp. TaxID=1871086 RepID=UPI0028A8B120|nr:hypothetical protein [Brevundimonas sp.]
MKIRNAFAIIALGMGVTAIILFGWIGFVFAINTYTPVAMTAEAALNLILVLLLATAGLPILHAAVYRWFWHIRRRREAGAYSRGEPIPAFGSEPTAPPPRAAKTTRQRLLYSALYVVGILSLLAAYAPIGHQEGLAAFLERFSAGRASFTSLATLIVIFLPMAISFALLAPLVERDSRRLNAGLADAAEVLRLQAKQEWLFSFATAFVMTGFLAFFAGNLILSFL